MVRFMRNLAALGFSLVLCGCSMVAQPSEFLMPDGQRATFVSLPGGGTTPPVVAVITPKTSPFNVQVVSTTPVVQSVFQNAAAGVALGGGIAAQGALIRPDRFNNTSSASGGQGGNATGGNATGGSATGGTACIGTC